MVDNDPSPEMEIVCHGRDPKTGAKILELKMKKGQKMKNKPKTVKAPKSFLKWEYPDGYSFCITSSFVSGIMKKYSDPAEQKSKLDCMTYYEQDPATLVRKNIF